MSKVIFYGEVELSDEQKADAMFINQANMLADGFGLRINWETSDTVNKILDFEGNASDEDVMNFLSKLERVLYSIYGDELEVE